MQPIQEQAGVPKYADYGSVEKLRSALNTPIRNYENFFVNQLGITPRISGGDIYDLDKTMYCLMFTNGTFMKFMGLLLNDQKRMLNELISNAA
jgi:hypothetical protein